MVMIHLILSLFYHHYFVRNESIVLNPISQEKIMPTNNNLILLTVIILSTGAVVAMEEFYKMTIENQFYAKMFLNVENPDLLTDKSPYAYVKGKKTKSFLLSQKEIAKQSIAFPSHWPTNKVQLPIDKKETYFTIKKHPTDNNKTIVEDDSKKIIAELLVISNSQK